MPSQLWALLKGFIPVFRFFEAGEILPTLEFRTEEKEMVWRPLIEKAEVGALSLFHNPELNMNLHLYSLVHELAQDHLDKKTNSFAERKILQVLRFQSPKFQYRLRNSLTDDVIFTSEWFDVKPS